MININIKKSAKENQPDVFKHGNSHRIESKRVKRLFIGTISLWTLIVIFLILSIFYYSNIGIQQNLLGEARAIYNMDLADRQWATMHGGIYVPVTDKTSPNPYLKNIGNRDVVTTNGTKLTLMNPEYILRELNENFKSGFGVYGHLTSLNPIRKENSPDNWERDALTKLSSNQNEYFEFVDIYGIKHIKEQNLNKL